MGSALGEFCGLYIAQMRCVQRVNVPTNRQFSCGSRKVQNRSKAKLEEEETPSRGAKPA